MFFYIDEESLVKELMSPKYKMENMRDLLEESKEKFDSKFNINDISFLPPYEGVY